MLVDVISVLVAFIPEGLPISVTLSLTIVANKMKNAKVLCKSLTTVETLGAVNIICRYGYSASLLYDISVMLRQ